MPTPETKKPQDEINLQDSRIFQFTAEDFLGLKAVGWKPGRNLNEVMGENGAGKSSLLTAIFAILGGKRAIPDQPIRRGANTARLTVQIGREEVELSIKLNISPKSSTIEVRTKKGAIVPSPQALLDALYEKVSFDPLAFMEKPAKDQVRMLVQASGSDFDLDESEGREKELRAVRESKGREVKQHKGYYDSLTPPDGKVPKERASSEEIRQRVTVARAQHDKFRDIEVRLTEASNELARSKSLLEQYDTKIANLEAQLEAARNDRAAQTGLLEMAETAVKETTVEVDAVRAQLPDMDAILDELNNVETINKKIDNAEKYTAAKQQYDASKKEYDDLTSQIESELAAREKALGTVQFNDPNLAFSKDGITYKGIPIEQASGAEKLKTCIGIAIALNPQLKVITIRDGALLDEKNMQLLNELAVQHDFQVFVERVGEKGGTSGIIIRDGEIAEIVGDGADNE